MPLLPPTPPPAHVAPSRTRTQTYRAIPCAELAEAVGKPGTSVAAWYGSLMAEALRRHGFEAAWPHVPAEIIGHAMTDWTGCFMPEGSPQVKKR